MQININERDEMEFLSMVLKVLRKYELSPDLFPELKEPEAAGPYFIMHGTQVRGVCTDLYAEMLEKYGGDKSTTTKDDKQPVT